MCAQGWRRESFSLTSLAVVTLVACGTCAGVLVDTVGTCTSVETRVGRAIIYIIGTVIAVIPCGADTSTILACSAILTQGFI